jgi:hypothetical protein
VVITLHVSDSFGLPQGGIQQRKINDGFLCHRCKMVGLKIDTLKGTKLTNITADT